jgi:hypothetical protein
VNQHTLGLRVVWVAALAVASAAVPAGAQQTDAAPYGNLFGAARTPQNQSLDIRGQLFGGYDDNLLAQAPNTNGTDIFDPRIQVPGATTGLMSTASYDYARTGRGKSATQFRIGGAGSVQEFTGADSKPFWTHHYNAGTSLGSNLTPRISFSLSGTGSYMPYYQYIPLLGTAAGPSGTTVDQGTSPEDATAGTAATPLPPFAIDLPPSIGGSVGNDLNFATQAAFVESWSAGASVTDRITKRSTLSANVQWDETQVFNQSTIQNRSARARIAHQLTRTLGFHAGFGVQDVRFDRAALPQTQVLNQLLDVGLDFGDGITIAKYYRLSFSTGTSALRQDNITQFFLTGNASLARSIGRTWSASITANRGTTYIVGFGNPFFSDTVSAGVGGRLARRLSLTGGFTYLRGQNIYSSATGRLISETASTKLTFAAGQHVGVYAQYAYYQYDVPDGFSSTIAFPQHLHRRSASVGLTFWVPVLNPRSERQP